MTFDEYLRARGYDPKARALVLRRMFVDVWAEPSFRDFWRVWNPAYGYVLHRLYVVLGGKRRPALASLTVFAACGFLLHDLPVWTVTGRAGVATTSAFVVYWLFVVTERSRSARAKPARVAANVGRVLLGLVVGGIINRLVGARW